MDLSPRAVQQLELLLPSAKINADYINRCDQLVVIPQLADDAVCCGGFVKSRRCADAARGAAFARADAEFAAAGNRAPCRAGGCAGGCRGRKEEKESMPSAGLCLCLSAKCSTKSPEPSLEGGHEFRGDNASSCASLCALYRGCGLL